MSATSTERPADLWGFSCAFYARPDVASACLRCQDEAGADVLLLLYALWQASRGVVLSRDEFSALNGVVQAWRTEVVQKLRAVRRHLDAGDTPSLREMVKAAELSAERVQMAKLEAAARASHHQVRRDPVARVNVAAYAASAGLSLPTDAVDAVLAAFQSFAAVP